MENLKFPFPFNSSAQLETCRCSLEFVYSEFRKARHFGNPLTGLSYEATDDNSRRRPSGDLMAEFFHTLFSLAGSITKNDIAQGSSEMLWINVVSDLVLALSYFTILYALIYFFRRRKEHSFNRIFLLFSGFIFVCGALHLLEIATIWLPYNGFQVLIKFVAGAISVTTAAVFWRLMPVVIKLPSPRDLEQKNKDLQKLIEQLRLTSVSRLHQVIESAPNGLLMVDQKGKIVLCNAQIESLFGYPKAELLGMTIEFLIPERFRQIHPHHRTGYFANPETRQMGVGRDLSGLRKDGKEFPVEIGLNPVKTDEGQFVLASIVDITERKKIAKELIFVKEAAEAANLAKSAFLANMSHEIRTPLGAMMGFSDLIVDPNVGPSEKANFVSAIKRNGELLSSIINDILDLSKIEAGKMQIVTHEVGLTEILSDTKTLLELQANDKGIALNIVISENMPEIIRTDPLRLRQVLINIIGNAIKFTNKGSVEVKIQLLPSSQLGHDQLVFIVKDTGCGINPDQAKKLFAPFSQADFTSKRKYGGTGLGLVLSQRFANLLGGDVQLTESIPSKGSTFTITIDPGPIQIAKHDQLIESKSVVFHGEVHRLDGIKVLLAEDSPDNQLVVSRFLKLSGAKVEVASNGQEAIESTKLDNYDIILMDLQMPVMDGYEATAELRKDGYSGKIIALTAHALSDDRERCLQRGFDEHIGKPVNRKDLIDMVDHLTRQEKSRETNNFEI